MKYEIEEVKMYIPKNFKQLKKIQEAIEEHDKKNIYIINLFKDKKMFKDYKDDWEKIFDKSDEIRECCECGKINLFIKIPLVITDDHFPYRQIIFDENREGYYDWCMLGITETRKFIEENNKHYSEYTIKFKK